MLKEKFSVFPLLIVIVLSLSYLLIGFVIVKDYGITADEPQDFGIGHKYLYFYQSGHLDFNDQLPKIANHPDFYNQFVKVHYPSLFPLANILSAASCTLFFEKLGWLKPIPAHHFIIVILTSLFMFALFILTRKRLGSTIAVLSVLFLITNPRFFGETLNNVKDVPALIFLSLTILFFNEWACAKKARYMYLGFLFWAFTLATKMDGVFVPLILLIWQLPRVFRLFLNGFRLRLRIVLHILLGIVLSFTSLIFFYPSLLPVSYPNWAEYSRGLLYFCGGFISYFFIAGLNKSISWNIYALSQIFYTMPVVTLFLFSFGLVYCFKKARKENTCSLLLIWFFLPVLRHSLPWASHYDGLRHFLYFLVPFSIIAALGLISLADYSVKFLKLSKSVSILILTSFFLIPNFYSLVNLHPYQNTYFNILIGGLKGAQKADFPYSCDYWFNSYQSAGAWLDRNAKNGARCYSFSASSILKYSLTRKDLELADSLPEDISKIISNSYIVVVAKKSKNKPFSISRAKLLSDIKSKYSVVYNIKRQGGEILSIYYKP